MDEKDIKPLDSEIQLVQIEKFMDDFDMAMKKDIRKRLKKFLFILIPFALSIVGYFIFNSTIFLIVGLGIFASSTIVKLTSDLIDDIKK